MRKLFRVAEVLWVFVCLVFLFWMLLNITEALATQSLLFKTVIKKLFIINPIILDSE